jgi:hypothetical protein
MKKRDKKKIGVVIVLVVLVLLSIQLYKNGKQTDVVGGERDEHGCLGPAGYSYNETIQACVREWELDSNDKRQAAKIAIDYIEPYHSLTILMIEPEECIGCFDVLVVDQENDPPKQLRIDKWQVIPYGDLTPEECLAKGGRILNIVAGDTCNEDEKNIGKVIGFISPNICCVPDNVYACTEESREGDFCITLYEPVCGYPLELDFSNNCFACLNERIEYYIEGECE